MLTSDKAKVTDIDLDTVLSLSADIFDVFGLIRYDIEEVRAFSKSFKLDGRPLQRGGYEIIIKNDFIGLNRMNARTVSSSIVVNPVIFSDWTDSSDTPYASVADFIDEVESFIYQ